MSKFIALYCMPASGLEEWMAKPAEERAPIEKELQQKWQDWRAANAGAVSETSGAGANQRVTEAGVASQKNEVMMYSIVEAENAEAAAKIFVGHPHFAIPGAWIDVMPANPLPGMGS